MVINLEEWYTELNKNHDGDDVSILYNIISWVYITSITKHKSVVVLNNSSPQLLSLIVSQGKSTKCITMHTYYIYM